MTVLAPSDRPDAAGTVATTFQGAVTSQTIDAVDVSV